MVIDNYKIEINEEGKKELFAIKNGKEIFVQVIDAEGYNSMQLDELARQVLDIHNYTIVKDEEDKGEHKMNRKKRVEIESNMNDVIETSRLMRDKLLDESVDFEDKLHDLKLFKTALDANRSIVSASIVQIRIEDFK